MKQMILYGKYIMPNRVHYDRVHHLIWHTVSYKNIFMTRVYTEYAVY